jgi:hypothetical protein
MITLTEHEIQNLAVNALRKIGFICIVTSNRKRTANTKGTPDVFVYVKNGLWIALEFKQPKGIISKEQIYFNSVGSSYIVYCVDTAVKVCLEAKAKVVSMVYSPYKKKIEELK